jgi:hypothetical protein
MAVTDQSVDPTFEAFLRGALAEAASGPVPTELPRSARTRVRARQASFSIMAAAVTLVVFSFGASALGLFESDRYIEVGGKQLNERGAGGRYPCDAKEVFGRMGEKPVACIATGSYEGFQWAVGTAWSRHGLCMVTSTMAEGYAAGTGMSCDTYDSEGIGIEAQGFGSEPNEQMFMTGYVPGNTERLFLERHGDEPMELQLYPTPEELGAGYISLDAKFYVVWAPDDADAFVAYDGDSEIARRSIDGDPPRNPDPPERLAITDFTAHDVNYVFDVYGDEVGGIEMACTAVSARGERSTITGNGTCHQGFPDENALSVAQTRLGDGQLVAIHGVVRSEVAALWARTPGQERFEVEIIPTPKGIEKGIAFFLFQVADGFSIDKPLTVSAEDARGNVIQERTIKINE